MALTQMLYNVSLVLVDRGVIMSVDLISLNMMCQEHLGRVYLAGPLGLIRF